MRLGELGVWASPRLIPPERLPEAAVLAELLGYGAFWLGASPQLPTLRPLLAATERIVVATGIVNVWTVEPHTVAAQFAAVDREFPGRVLLGLGVGHPEATSEYRTPLAVMRAFLDGLDAADAPVPADRRCLAALGPRMLELSRDRSLGAAPYFTPAEHTAAARRLLGEGPLLAPEVAFVLEEQTGAARATARAYAEGYLRLRNYTQNLLRHGFDESDLAGGGSDRLIDAVIPHGTAAAVADAVGAHLAAGADHVCVQALGEPGVPERSWTEIVAAR